jgi:hypothetical protein
VFWVSGGSKILNRKLTHALALNPFNPRVTFIFYLEKKNTFLRRKTGKVRSKLIWQKRKILFTGIL